MPAIPAQLVDALCSADDAARVYAATQIYNIGIAPALRIADKWQQNTELAGLLAAPTLHVTAGLAVFPSTFANIHAASGHPALAEVPPDQDAQEFELHYPNAVSLDILTSGEPDGNGAIAKFLNKFGQGIQQIEFQCKNVDRATEILNTAFAANAVYPATRQGANNTRINFFLVPAENEKLLIELYEL
ncbi:MAG: hypothetical protein ABSG69_07570 [Candidatus Acidiferrum sp.]|jgi:hypothetical protein